MPTKEQIINNIREYSAIDIVKAIKKGEVSLYELSKSGVLTPLMKKRIEEQLACTEDNDSQNESKGIKAESIETEAEFVSDGTPVSEQAKTEVLLPMDNVTNSSIDLTETI